MVFLGLTLAGIGFYGIVFNFKNFLITRLCIELTYVGCSFVLLVLCCFFNLFVAQIYALTLILLAAGEAAIGLGLLIAIYRYEKTIFFLSFRALGA